MLLFRHQCCWLNKLFTRAGAITLPLEAIGRWCASPETSVEVILPDHSWNSCATHPMNTDMKRVVLHSWKLVIEQERLLLSSLRHLFFTSIVRFRLILRHDSDYAKYITLLSSRKSILSSKNSSGTFSSVLIGWIIIFLIYCRLFGS